MPITPPIKAPDKTSNHLANERTFLAWIRTSISIIVFGFVIARFGIALREFLLVQSHPIQESNTSLEIGIVFMITGTLIAVTSLFRYQATMRRIETCRYKPEKLITLLVAVFTALFGATLIIYLIVTAESLG